jgi:hypothetical protein
MTKNFKNYSKITAKALSGACLVAIFAASTAQADQLTLKSNGDVGIGTANPSGNLDIYSGLNSTKLMLTNDFAQWEIKNNAATQKFTISNKMTGVKPLKIGINANSNLLTLGTNAPDEADIDGTLNVTQDVNVTGTLFTGGMTCSGGCDAVFGADYDLPSIEDHARAMFANSYLPAVGPTRPFEQINLADKMGNILNELEKAHIYIAQQEARLAKLEKLLAE